MNRAPSAACPACGAPLSSDAESDGLCMACLFELALESPSLLAELDDQAAETLASPEGTFAPGSILGERYRVRSLLGRGGMGEVWRAFDLKLRVDVALKAVRPKWIENERILDTLRQEVRSARQVMSPNVCRVFDLIEIDGRELVSMEYVDGITLLDILRMRAPLELTEAREIASQFLAGLEAIHEAGLVHRDVKPENIMMTRSGRVVVMDFGIAKSLAEVHSGTISGTAAYMPPEQARGESVTSRSDVFSAGVVLAEMVSPGGLRTAGARQRIWERVHRQPPEVPDTPWAPVLAIALAAIPEQRHPSASALARALEEVTLRAAGEEDLHPYPGLASFTEENAEYFFGRELEVEEMWKKLQRPHLLGLIGPSGAGKSSFLRAGLLPTTPAGWRVVVTTPGDRPFVALGQAFADELAGDQEALRELPRIAEPDVAVMLAKRWRSRHTDALLVVDQFEELFTQNPDEIRARFSALLGRLALEANLHVLVSMRDDFLFHCSEQPALSPMFSELTPLRPPVGAALRRSLVQPALKCGYRFEDENLVDEMVAEVGGERGALPLLAFAAARLWDHRDRERGLLTREAYERIGGVAGALAQHAEATLERVGQDRIPVVRELFRNLVTGQGTRAVRDHEELLSVFTTEERATVESVLDALVDARLLVSYEAEAEPDAVGDEMSRPPERRRIEIVHESLLTQWPRLVRWRMQDEEGAQLRDQLRQAARLWQERGRPDDLLWAGTSFKEYALWRERYAGGLSEGEEQFARAMGSRAARQKRQRRLAVAAVVLLALGVATVTSSLWRRSEVARGQAVAAGEEARDEARRAEASKLLALARLELEVDVTAALAYATASLGLADTPEARLFALRALATSPPARVLLAEEAEHRWTLPDFSPDGEWMTLNGRERLEVIGRDGTNRRLLGSFPSTGGMVVSRFSPEGDRLLATKGGELRIWSVPGFEQTHARQIPVPREFATGELQETATGLFLLTLETGYGTRWEEAGLWPLLTPLSFDGEPGETMRLVGVEWMIHVHPSGGRLAYQPMDEALGGYPANGPSPEVWVRLLDDRSAPPSLLARHEATISSLCWHPDGRSIAVLDRSGELRLWPSDAEGAEPLRTLRGVEGALAGVLFDEVGEQLATWALVAGGNRYELWDLSAPVEGRPAALTLPRSRAEAWDVPEFSPDGRWLTTSHPAGRALWPLARERALVLAIPGDPTSLDMDVAFTGRGRLVSTSHREVREWNLSPGGQHRVLTASGGAHVRRLAVDPAGRFVVATTGGSVMVLPFDGGPIRTLLGTQQTWAVALDAEGRRVAAASMRGEPEDKVIRIWDLANGELRTLGPVEGAATGSGGSQSDFEFLPGERFVSVGPDGLRLWDLGDGTSRVLAPSAPQEPRLAIFDGGRQVAYTSVDAEVAITDLETGTTRIVSSHGSGVWPVAVDPAGTVLVTGSDDGTVRVGPITGEEPHILLGHEGRVRSVAVSPDGRRIASIAEDHTIRVWAMPDVVEPPLQALPYDELLAKLHSLTNVRAVEDEESATGWTVAYEPFPGWEQVPTW